MPSSGKWWAAEFKWTVSLNNPTVITQIAISEKLSDILRHYICNSRLMIRSNQWIADWETLGFKLEEKTGRKDDRWIRSTLYRMDALDHGRYNAQILPTEEQWNALVNATPTFDQIIAWIARKYPQHILSVGRERIRSKEEVAEICVAKNIKNSQYYHWIEFSCIPYQPGDF